MVITIYALKCRPTGMVYVGSTKGKLAKRVREHRCLLNKGVHSTKRLQQDWKHLGGECFSYVELEIFLYDHSLATRRAAEIRWMDYFAKDGLLYNEHRISMRPTDEAIARGVEAAKHAVGERWSAEANERRRKAQLGIPKGHGAKISATKRAKRQQVMR